VGGRPKNCPVPLEWLVLEILCTCTADCTAPIMGTQIRPFSAVQPSALLSCLPSPFPHPDVSCWIPPPLSLTSLRPTNFSPSRAADPCRGDVEDSHQQAGVDAYAAAATARSQ